MTAYKQCNLHPTSQHTPFRMFQLQHFLHCTFTTPSTPLSISTRATESHYPLPRAMGSWGDEGERKTLPCLPKLHVHSSLLLSIPTPRSADDQK